MWRLRKATLPSLAARQSDAERVWDLPSGVDANGRHGDFYSFFHAGPALARPLTIAAGEVGERTVFSIAGLPPA